MKTKRKPSHVIFKFQRSIVPFSPQTECNGIIKGWLHRLTSGSQGRFLVNNILMFDSA